MRRQLKEPKRKYLTTTDGLGYRDIAKIMCKAGDKMNYTTAHNQFLKSVKKILEQVCIDLNIEVEEEHLAEVSKNQEVHEALHNVLYLAYEYKKTQEEKSNAS